MIAAIATLLSCNPDFLDLKRDRAQAVPVSLEDFDAMLGNTTVFNHTSGHSMGSVSGEEFQLTSDAYSLLSRPEEKSAYLWQDEYYIGIEAADWNYPYRRVLYCNIILEGLERLEDQEISTSVFSEIRGAALFHKASAFFMLSQQFAAPYGDTEHAAYGIPLISDSDPTEPSRRSSVEETYRFIVDGLQEATVLLPDESLNVFRPNKAAAYALLARVYLAMADYENALHCADEALAIKSSLYHFATVDNSPVYPFPVSGRNNPEIIFYDVSHYAEALLMSRYRVNPELFDLYGTGDLRSGLFFRSEATGGHSYRGSYSGGGNFFTGLATDELYLIRAECLVRNGETQQGLDALNLLLDTRHQTGQFTPYTGLDRATALETVLTERRKELLNRGLRWTDLRRYSFLEEKNRVLEREMEGTSYSLPARDRRYTFLVPNNVTANSDVVQFPR